MVVAKIVHGHSGSLCCLKSECTLPCLNLLFICFNFCGSFLDNDTLMRLSVLFCVLCICGLVTGMHLKKRRFLTHCRHIGCSECDTMFRVNLMSDSQWGYCASSFHCTSWNIYVCMYMQISSYVLANEQNVAHLLLCPFLFPVCLFLCCYWGILFKNIFYTLFKTFLHFFKRGGGGGGGHVIGDFYFYFYFVQNLSPGFLGGGEEGAFYTKYMVLSSSFLTLNGEIWNVDVLHAR